MDRSYSYNKRIKLIAKQDLESVVPAYPESISTKYSFLDEQELICPTGITLVSSQILPGEDFYYNLITNCSESVSPLRACVISYRRSFEHICNKLLAIQTGALLEGRPQRLSFCETSKKKLNDVLDSDNIQINAAPPLRIDDLITYMGHELKEWTGIYFIDRLNSFIYETEEEVLEKLYRFSTQNQRPVVIYRQTESEEGEKDKEHSITFLASQLLKTVTNHIIYVGWQNENTQNGISIYVESNKDIGLSDIHSLEWNYLNGKMIEELKQ